MIVGNVTNRYGVFKARSTSTSSIVMSFTHKQSQRDKLSYGCHNFIKLMVIASHSYLNLPIISLFQYTLHLTAILKLHHHPIFLLNHSPLNILYSHTPHHLQQRKPY
jgi:hypothetical protein